LKKSNQIFPFKDASVMDALFPFFILIQKDMKIVRVGRSITKLGLGKIGEPFLNHFTVERPRETNTFEEIKRQDCALFILEVHDKIGFKFRGQMYYDAPNDQLYFLGSPLLKSFDDLKEVELILTDFALHDNINQFLFSMQMMISSLKDSKNIADSLEKSNRVLQQKNEELQNFAHILSHDLKTPIRGVLTLSEFMQEDIENNQMDEVNSHIEAIKRRVIRMNGLIEGILDFSKIGMLKSKKESIDLNVLINEIFEDAITKENIVCTIKTKLPIIHNVRVLFVQLFSNLISNAVKHNDKEQGGITVDYEASKDFHEFSVADNGPGIAKSYHEKIFKLYQTLNEDEEIDSTGVGLSIVKKIITVLNGTITLESKLNEGTTFYIKIPNS